MELYKSREVARQAGEAYRAKMDGDGWEVKALHSGDGWAIVLWNYPVAIHIGDDEVCHVVITSEATGTCIRDSEGASYFQDSSQRYFGDPNKAVADVISRAWRSCRRILDTIETAANQFGNGHSHQRDFKLYFSYCTLIRTLATLNLTGLEVKKLLDMWLSQHGMSEDFRIKLDCQGRAGVYPEPLTDRGRVIMQLLKPHITDFVVAKTAKYVIGRPSAGSELTKSETPHRRFIIAEQPKSHDAKSYPFYLVGVKVSGQGSYSVWTTQRKDAQGFETVGEAEEAIRSIPYVKYRCLEVREDVTESG